MEFLRELFSEPLSFEAFSKAVQEKGIKLADLSTGKYADIDKLNKANGDLKTANDTIKTLKEEVQTLKDSNASAEDWKKKFEDLTADIEAKEEISYEDFMKMQFQIGEVIACEAVPKSKKLLCSKVKIGSQVKQIVSGIRKDYSPEEMVGKKVMVLVNLKPAKLAGVLSEGMLLCAEDENGELSLMVPEKKMPSGAEIA